jgi:hypothetical protein
MTNPNFFSPGSWQFWSNPSVRPKRTFEGMLLFGDVIFGGAGANSFPPFMVKSFSRPGYTEISTQAGEYQLRTGDFARIDYPTQGFATKDLNITLADVNILGPEGADTAGHVNTSLTMMQKTWTYEEVAMGTEEGSENDAYQRFIDGYIAGNPQIITILELDGNGGVNGEWSIYKPVLSAVKFSDFNYETEQLASIDLTFKYKNFKFTQGWSEKELDMRLNAASKERQQVISNWIERGSKWLASTY